MGNINDNEKFRLNLIKSCLVDFTDGCRDDMHEPDNQGISARVVGDILDNAHGNYVDIAQIKDGFQEFVVILQKEGQPEPALFNLADLIALARMSRVE